MIHATALVNTRTKYEKIKATEKKHWMSVMGIREKLEDEEVKKQRRKKLKLKNKIVKSIIEVNAMYSPANSNYRT